MATLPKYLQEMADEKKQEIVEGFEILLSIVPTLTVKEYAEQLYKDYVRVVAFNNTLYRAGELADERHALEIATRQSLEHFGWDFKAKSMADSSKGRASRNLCE